MTFESAERRGSSATSATVQLADIERAAARIAPYISRTPILRSRGIDELCGARVAFKCENFQRGGAFKFRGACNAVWSLSDPDAARGVVTHSSGNHGAALALAARSRGIAAHVVVPHGANKSKLAAIEAYGAAVHFCEPTLAAREAATDDLRRATGATLIHPFTSPAVIAGQGTAALELLRAEDGFDALITPIGGGGLIGGTAIVTRALLPSAQIFAAEPEGAADAFESLRRGVRVTDIQPATICDGLRAGIGAINFNLLRDYGVRVLLVSDAQTTAAMRLVFERMKIVIEASSATALAAVLRYRELFAGRNIGIVVSGGNVDFAQLPWQADATI